MTKKTDKPKGKHGGPRPGAGRKPLLPDIAPLEDRRVFAEEARKYAMRMLAVLVDIAENGESEAARAAAANSVLDRGLGKPQQVVGMPNDDGDPASVQETFEAFAKAMNEMAAKKASKE